MPAGIEGVTTRRADARLPALRSGVKFHDGATFDADDVVLSFAVQWDAEHPLHAGHEGVFTIFAWWFGGFLNPPSG